MNMKCTAALNCGVGMVICVPADTAPLLITSKCQWRDAFVLGTIEESKAGQEQVQLLGLTAELRECHGSH